MNGIQGYRCQLYKDNSLQSLSLQNLRYWSMLKLRASSVSPEVYRKKGRCLRIRNHTLTRNTVLQSPAL